MAIEDIKNLIGSELGVSDWITIDQNRINGFADVTEDHNEVHINRNVAREWGFEDCFAHGFLTLSMILRLQEDVVPYPPGIKSGFNYGLEHVRFLSPVIAGKRIRGRFTLKSMDETRPGTWRSSIGVIIEIEGHERPAVAAEWLNMVSLQ